MRFEEIYKLIRENVIDTIVMDFDHTITTYDSETTIGVFSKVLDTQYVKEKHLIDIKVNKCKNKIEMLCLWSKKIYLLKKFKAINHINEVLKYFRIDSSFKALFKYCKKKNIKIIICSAGYKPLITEILKQNQINNVQIIANEDESNIVTPMNKSKFIHTKSKRIMLIGDSITDSKMVKKESIKVAICNDLNKYYELNKYFDYVVLNDFQISKELNTSKSKIKIGLCCGTKILLKSIDDVNEEIKRYNLLKKYYKTSEVVIKYKDYALYNYIEDFENKKIYDYLYCKFPEFDSKIIFDQYRVSLNKTLCNKSEQECESKKFFYERANLIEEYLNKINFENVILGGKTFNLKSILQEIVNKIKESKKLYAFITQGDPTDMNMTTTGYFIDYENAGYNAIISEISIFFISLYSHGRYFYPRYNPTAYSTNKQTIKKIKCTIKANYTISNNDIYVKNFNNYVGIKNKKLISDFIDVFLNNKKYQVFKRDFKYLKYYICMRILTPIDIFAMNQKDRIVLLILLIKVYNEIQDLNSLKEFIGGVNESI